MSHIATNWAFQQRGLKPTAKIILLILADCHNPTHGCFPTQAYLAHHCEVNRDTVNAHLASLEEMGLIRRVRSVDPQTRRQRPTRYKLAFEDDFELPEGGKPEPEGGANPVSEIPTQPAKAVSEKPAEPCRKNTESRVGNSDTNLVIEQVNKPAHARTHTRGGVIDDGGEADEDFRRFWQAHPRPRNRERTRQAWLTLRKEGHEGQFLLEQAARYRTDCQSVQPQYRVSSDIWLEKRRWQAQADDAAGAAEASDAARYWAGIIRAGRFVPSSAISQGVAREMTAAGLVTRDQLRGVGIHV